MWIEISITPEPRSSWNYWEVTPCGHNSCLCIFLHDYVNFSLCFYHVCCMCTWLLRLSVCIAPVIEEMDPCNPSRCGPYSQCRKVSGHGVCSCLPTYIGSPTSCRPECVASSECSQNRACVNQKCVDPCPGPCGLNTRCEVINHSPVCSCHHGFTGDSFTQCYAIPRKHYLNHLISVQYQAVSYHTYSTDLIILFRMCSEIYSYQFFIREYFHYSCLSLLRQRLCNMLINVFYVVSNVFFVISDFHFIWVLFPLNSKYIQYIH